VKQIERLKLSLILWLSYNYSYGRKEKNAENKRNEIFYEIHANIPRQGPGNIESTDRAFGMIAHLPSNPKILDVGCGPGLQTVELAKLSGGEVIGLDLTPSFLDELKAHAENANLASKIKMVEGSMSELPFNKESFDVVWSEGAIYIIGFERGLKEWRPLLKSEGYMIASHISWLKDEIPEKPKKFWGKNYPTITTVDENLKIAKAAGYKVVGHFTLPEAGWWDDYYLPEEENLRRLREKYKDNPEAIVRIDSTQEEIDLYREYSDCYGYVFYVLQKEVDREGQNSL
jgi:ubiquinone/menaquinone biosynthesis C-methylase UbiE